jgi:putative heme-binding domain-containing protein
MLRARPGTLALVAALALPLGAVAARSQTAPAAAGQALVKSMPREEVAAKLTAATWAGKPAREEGGAIYEKVCAACHLFGEVGKNVGPDLSTLASRFKKGDVLDSILFPSKTISDQYQMTMVELNDGTTHSGLVFREDRQYLYLKNADYLDRPLPVKLTDIKERLTSTVSLMPEGLVNDYSLQQLDSLVAYLLAGPK